MDLRNMYFNVFLYSMQTNFVLKVKIIRRFLLKINLISLIWPNQQYKFCLRPVLKFD